MGVLKIGKFQTLGLGLGLGLGLRLGLGLGLGLELRLRFPKNNIWRHLLNNMLISFASGEWRQRRYTCKSVLFYVLLKVLPLVSRFIEQ